MSQVSLLYLSFVAYCMAILLYLFHIGLRRDWVLRFALGLFVAGFILQSTCLGLRWYEGGYLPVTNLFATQFFFSWALAATYLYFELRYRIHAAGLFVMLCNLLLFGSVLPRSAKIPPLIPALDTTTVYFARISFIWWLRLLYHGFFHGSALSDPEAPADESAS